jgi:hypothetical protein
MRARRRVPCLAAIGSLLLAATGCGNDVPTTGDSLQATPDAAAKGKEMADGYMKKAAMQKSQSKVRSSGPQK